MTDATQTIYTAWVADDGSYGAGKILLFDANALTDLEWEIVSEETNDVDRLDIVKQMLNNKLDKE